MNPETEPFYDLEASLAQQIAVLMSEDGELAEAAAPAQADDMADLFLEELNRLWADPAPLTLS